VTVAASSAAVAATPVGASGAGSAGVTDVLADDAEEFPAELRAITVNVYPVPFVKPETVHVVLDVVHVNPPGFEVTT
jgi:hypothetical protein